MIVVDTSALVATLLREPPAEACAAALEDADTILISAATYAEAVIVADRRGFGQAMTGTVEGLGMEVVSLTAAGVAQVRAAYAAWGKGIHPAGLNLGDCFAYALARARDCPLLYVGDDFARTDIRPAI